MTTENTETMNNYIARGFMMLCTTVIAGLVAWIGFNVADIPVIKAQMTNLAADLTSQGARNSQRIEDHEGRIRTLEDRRHP